MRDGLQGGDWRSAGGYLSLEMCLNGSFPCAIYHLIFNVKIFINAFSKSLFNIFLNTKCCVRLGAVMGTKCRLCPDEHYTGQRAVVTTVMLWRIRRNPAPPRSRRPGAGGSSPGRVLGTGADSFAPDSLRTSVGEAVGQ